MTPKSSITTIYCDLDGVLCDFMHAAEKVLGHPFGSKDVDALPREDAEKVLSEDPRFWHHLPWMPDGQELWNSIKHLNVHILTARARWDNNSPDGKRFWCAKNLGIPMSKVHVVRRSEKANYSLPTACLIDDYEKNIAEWAPGGGLGIRHTNTLNTVKTLKRYNIL